MTSTSFKLLAVSGSGRASVSEDGSVGPGERRGGLEKKRIIREEAERLRRGGVLEKRRSVREKEER